MGSDGLHSSEMWRSALQPFCALMRQRSSPAAPEEGASCCCSSSTTKMVLVSVGEVLCLGEGYRDGRRASVHHRKVSVEEPPPGVSGLTSTLTQATFSWLLCTHEEDENDNEMSACANLC